MTAELSCRESVTYSQGTDDTTVRRELFRAPSAVFPEMLAVQLDQVVLVGAW